MIYTKLIQRRRGKVSYLSSTYGRITAHGMPVTSHGRSWREKSLL